MPWTTICVLNELTEGQGHAVEIDGYRLAVFLNGGVPHVLDDTCPHAGASMAAGWVEAGCAVCPRHAWRFDLGTGRLHGTDADGLKTYRTRTIEFNGQTLLQAELAMP